MHNRRYARYEIIFVVFIVLSVVVWNIYTAAEHAGKYPIEFQTSPEDVVIFINNKKISSGIHYLSKGKYKLEAKKDGYKTITQTLQVNKDIDYISLIPEPLTLDAKRESNTSGVSSRSEAISATASQKSGVLFRKNNPAISNLPHLDLSGPFEINYNYEKDDENKVYYTVETISSEGRKSALKWLIKSGVDVTKSEVIFTDFSNPFIQEVYHD
jgi:hypothetical protein